MFNLCRLYLIIKRILGLFTLVKYKLIYGRRFSFSWHSRISSTLIIRMNNGSNCKLILGKNISIRDNVVFNLTNGKIIIGDNVFLNDNVSINARKNIIIGCNTIIGQSTKIYDHDHDYLKNVRTDFLENDVTISDDVWIGSNVIILRGSYIKDNVVIGAGTIVKGQVESNTVVYNKCLLQVKKYRKFD